MPQPAIGSRADLGTSVTQTHTASITLDILELIRMPPYLPMQQPELSSHLYPNSAVDTYTVASFPHAQGPAQH